jgi:hypothetical protein
MKVALRLPVLLGTAATALATALAGTPASASAAPAIGSCRPWHDSNSFGVSCTGGGKAAYAAVAVCRNGKAVEGPAEGGESGNWSYAYCTSVNSSLDHGYVQWYL